MIVSVTDRSLPGIMNYSSKYIVLIESAQQRVVLLLCITLVRVSVLRIIESQVAGTRCTSIACCVAHLYSVK